MNALRILLGTIAFFCILVGGYLVIVPSLDSLNQFTIDTSDPEHKVQYENDEEYQSSVDRKLDHRQFMNAIRNTGIILLSMGVVGLAIVARWSRKQPNKEIQPTCRETAPPSG